MRCGDLSDGLLWEVVNGRGEMQFEMLEWMDWLGWGVLIPFCLYICGVLVAIQINQCMNEILIECFK